MKTVPHVVIIGAGFGGLSAYHSIRKQFGAHVRITIINRTNYFLFTPLLHEVATGGLGHHQVVESIRQLIYKTPTELHLAEVKSIDLRRQQVKTSVATVDYDYLVIATGATSNYFDIPVAEEHTLGLKSLRDAIMIRNRIIEQFEVAHLLEGDERKDALRFAIIGGGATGVELAAELAEWIRDSFRRYYRNLNCDEVEITLINYSPELISQFSDRARHQALNRLKQLGVNVRLNTAVTSVTHDGVNLSVGGFLPTGLTLWMAGVMPAIPKLAPDVVVDERSGRLVVDRSLRLPGFQQVFVIGDASYVRTDDEHVLPMMAQVAERQGKWLGRALKAVITGREAPAFRYRSQGELLSLGNWHAAGTIWKVPISGPLGWWLWRTVYLFKFNSWSKRVKIAIDWTIDIFYPRDITKA